jgi:ABC-type multidrug transport system ATPase subunit
MKGVGPVDGPQDGTRSSGARGPAAQGPHGLEVTARGLGLRGPRGWAFRGVTVEAGPGSLIAVEGPSGSGRTCLLLALTGRMRPTEGVATVGGFKLPRHRSALRRVSALANVSGVTDLEPALTVGEHLRERALLQRRFGDSLRGLLRPRDERRAAARRLVDTALAAAGLDLGSLPKGPRTAVRDLERLEELRLSVALALVGRPRLLAVDDVDLKLSPAERDRVWELLRSLTEAGTTVVAVCSEAPEGAVVVPTGAAASAPGTAPGAAPAREAEEPGRKAGRETGGEADDGADDEAVGENEKTGETEETGEAGEAGEAEEASDEVKEAAADAFAETGRS